MKKLNVYYTDRQVESLNRLACQTDLKLSEHVRRAVDLYLAEMRKQGILDDSDLQVSA